MTAVAWNPANVLVGTAYGYTAVKDTALPADTVAYGTVWTSPWVYWGATSEGVSYGEAPQTQDITIEEQANPAAVGLNSVDYTIGATLAEDTMESLLLASGHGAIATVAASTGIPGTKTWTPGSTLTLNHLAVGFEGINTFGKYRRFWFSDAVATATLTAAYRRAAAPRLWAVTFRFVGNPATGVKIVEKTADAT